MKLIDQGIFDVSHDQISKEPNPYGVWVCLPVVEYEEALYDQHKHLRVAYSRCRTCWVVVGLWVTPPRVDLLHHLVHVQSIQHCSKNVIVRVWKSLYVHLCERHRYYKSFYSTVRIKRDYESDLYMHELKLVI